MTSPLFLMSESQELEAEGASGETWAPSPSSPPGARDSVPPQRGYPRAQAGGQSSVPEAPSS